TLRLADAHGAATTAGAGGLTAAGKLENGLEYETSVQAVLTGGKLTAADGTLRIEKAEALTILVAAGTSYLPDWSRKWRGEHPHSRIVRQLQAAAGQSYESLKAAHIANYRRLFNRVSLDLGTAGDSLATNERLVRYATGAADPEL